MISNNLHKNKLGLKTVNAWDLISDSRLLHAGLHDHSKEEQKIIHTILCLGRKSRQTMELNLHINFYFNSTLYHGHQVFHHQHTIQDYHRHIWFSSNILYGANTSVSSSVLFVCFCCQLRYYYHYLFLFFLCLT